MAKCSLCNKRGLFLKLNSNGICSQCEEEKKKLDIERKEQEERRKKREAYLEKRKIAAQAELTSLPTYKVWYSNEKRNRRKGYEELPFSNITPKGKYNDFVVFDTETTGLAPSKDRIIELAAIRFVNGNPVALFETLINPERDIPSEVTEINGITNEMVANAPTISQVLPAFEEFVAESALVAHNLEFDIKFLYYSGSVLTDSKRKYYDTLEQAKKLLKKPKVKYDCEYGLYDVDYESEYDVYDYKLETLCEYYDITMPGQHRAAADALVTGKLFLNLIEEKQSKY